MGNLCYVLGGYPDQRSAVGCPFLARYNGSGLRGKVLSWQGVSQNGPVTNFSVAWSLFSYQLMV